MSSRLPRAYKARKFTCKGYSFFIRGQAISYSRFTVNFERNRFTYGLHHSEIWAYSVAISRKNFNNFMRAFVSDGGLSWGIGQTKLTKDGIKITYLNLAYRDDYVKGLIENE